MSPDDPTLPPDDEPADGTSEEDGQAKPPPSTWAGGAGRGSEPEAGARQDDESSGKSWGFTDDFAAVERELGDSLDQRPTGEDRVDEEDGAEEVDEPREGGGEDELGEADADLEAADAGDAAERADEAEAVAAGETVEADTLSLSDREAAEEAALAGLRERAARNAAQQGSSATSGAEQDPGPAESDSEQEVVPAAVAGEASFAAAPTGGERSAGEPPRSRSLWARFLIASLVIVVSMATATSVTALVVLTDLADRFGGITGLEEELAEVQGGDPQTILILGSDRRLGIEGGDEDGARSDTAMLLRVDPDRDTINLLSIPRDLRIDYADKGIPRLGVDKFNAAYAHGGPKLALRVVKDLTDLDVNHVVDVNFTGFADAVNAIDCVFIDVDRRYFIPPETGIAEIDIEAGYQRLCGLKALQYVRFRHDDNDLVRAARQQDFLREARQKIPPSTMFAQRYELLDIFTEYTTSSESLADSIQLLELLKTFLAARSAGVNEIRFPARLGGPDDPYVRVNRGELREAVERFEGDDDEAGREAGEAGGEDEGGQDRGERQGGQGGGRQGGGGQGGGGQGGPQMVAAPIARDVAQQLARQTSPSGMRVILDFPVFYPTEVPARTNLNPIDASRAFPIDGPGDEVYEGYKFVFAIPSDGGFSEYWGVSGTNWRDAPILENPSETRQVDGREYLLFYDRDRVRLVGWKQAGRSYWVNNTLLQSLNEGEMMAIARSMRRLDG